MALINKSPQVLESWWSIEERSQEWGFQSEKSREIIGEAIQRYRFRVSSSNDLIDSEDMCSEI